MSIHTLTSQLIRASNRLDTITWHERDHILSRSIDEIVTIGEHLNGSVDLQGAINAIKLARASIENADDEQLRGVLRVVLSMVRQLHIMVDNQMDQRVREDRIR